MRRTPGDARRETPPCKPPPGGRSWRTCADSGASSRSPTSRVPSERRRCPGCCGARRAIFGWTRSLDSSPRGPARTTGSWCARPAAPPPSRPEFSPSGTPSRCGRSDSRASRTAMRRPPSGSPCPPGGSPAIRPPARSPRGSGSCGGRGGGGSSGAGCTRGTASPSRSGRWRGTARASRTGPPGSRGRASRTTSARSGSGAAGATSQPRRVCCAETRVPRIASPAGCISRRPARSSSTGSCTGGWRRAHGTCTCQATQS